MLLNGALMFPEIRVGDAQCVTNRGFHQRLVGEGVRDLRFGRIDGGTYRGVDPQAALLILRTCGRQNLVPEEVQDRF